MFVNVCILPVNTCSLSVTSYKLLFLRLQIHCKFYYGIPGMASDVVPERLLCSGGGDCWPLTEVP